jgi:LuxR family maltose regulon positive regulatory protein
LFHAWALLFNGQLDAVELRLKDIESHPRFKTVDDATTFENRKSKVQNQEATGQVTAIRSIVACYRGHPSVAIQLSRQALETVPKDNLFLRSIMALNIALNVADAYGSPTDVADAHQLLTEGVAISQAAGDTHMALMSLNMLGNVEVAQGRLHQASQTYRRALQLADEQVEQSRQSSPIVGAVYINMGEVMREWNDLDAALHHVLKGIELGQPGGDLRAITIGHFALARVYQAQGDMERSDQAIQQAAQFAQQSNITWLISKVAAYQARLWLARNNLSAAVRWTQQCGLNLSHQIGFQREGEYAILGPCHHRSE